MFDDKRNVQSVHFAGDGEGNGYGLAHNLVLALMNSVQAANNHLEKFLQMEKINQKGDDFEAYGQQEMEYLKIDLKFKLLIVHPGDCLKYYQMDPYERVIVANLDPEKVELQTKKNATVAFGGIYKPKSNLLMLGQITVESSSRTVTIDNQFSATEKKRNLFDYNIDYYIRWGNNGCCWASTEKRKGQEVIRFKEKQYLSIVLKMK